MPPRTTTPRTQAFAGELRKRQTEAEIKLWARLRDHRLQNIHFRRQHAIGRYVVDFCAPRQKLIIEVDGGQHLHQVEYDNQRTAYLQSLGYRVLRFWNNDVLNRIDAVLDFIIGELKN